MYNPFNDSNVATMVLLPRLLRKVKCHSSFKRSIFFSLIADNVTSTGHTTCKPSPLSTINMTKHRD